MQLFILRASWILRQFWIDYGELFRVWFERKVRWYKTGNNKEMFNFALFNTREKKSLQRYLLQDRFERGW